MDFFLIENLQRLAPEILWVGQLFVSFLLLLAALRFFGKIGVITYLCIALIAANIQVLKTVEFIVYQDPVALGTILFATTFLSTDILNEYFGAKTARLAVALGFFGMITFTLLMLITIGFRPLDGKFAETEWSWGLQNHEHMVAIFTPIPGIVAAGFSAYFISQFLDIWVYQRIRKLSSGKYKWLRNNLSTALSALVDSIVFSVLAWRIFLPEPLPWEVIVKSYIVGTYLLRLGVALLDTPILYVAGMIIQKQHRTDLSDESSS